MKILKKIGKFLLRYIAPIIIGFSLMLYKIPFYIIILVIVWAINLVYMAYKLGQNEGIKQE
jgi:hypothetical protein